MRAAPTTAPVTQPRVNARVAVCGVCSVYVMYMCVACMVSVYAYECGCGRVCGVEITRVY